MNHSKRDDIVGEIEHSGSAFHAKVNESLPVEVLDFIDRLTVETDVFLVGGLIRDFFLNGQLEDIRDVDLIYLDDIDMSVSTDTHPFHLNSFGGFKFTISDYKVDVWKMSNTWGLRKVNIEIEKYPYQALLESVFFNFQSIMFSIREKKFYFSEHFIDFLRDGVIDVVLLENPYPALCVINTKYYSERMNLPISEGLMSHLRAIFPSIETDSLIEYQVKRFGEQKYTLDDLESFLKN